MAIVTRAITKNDNHKLPVNSCQCGRFVQIHYMRGETAIVFKMRESPAKCGRLGSLHKDVKFHIQHEES